MKNLDSKVAVACLVAGVILLFSGIGLFLAAQEMSGPASYTLIAGIALLIVYGVLSPRAVVDLARNRHVRFGTLSLIVSSVVIGILVMANVIAAQGEQSIDVTRGQLFSLSPKSLAVIHQLKSDVQVTGFFRPGNNTSERRDDAALLAEYQKASPHVKVRFLDPDTNQELANRLGVTIDGSLTVQYQSKPAIVLPLGSQTESDLTGAILKLEATRTPQICWAGGEGQRDLKETQLFGYADAAAQLATDNFKARELVLAQTTTVPADCDVLAIVGLQQPLADPTIRGIQAFLDNGGRLILAIDPWLDKPVLDSANSLLQPYQASFDGGLVLETDPSLTSSNDPTTPLVSQYGGSPITAELNNRYTFFPQPTSISGQGATAVLVTRIAQTSSSSYEIHDARDKLDRQGGDTSGPFTLMATLEKVSGDRKMRVVLVGTSAFAENRTLPPNAPGYNEQLLLGSFDWLAGNDELIHLPAKPQTDLPLFLTTSDVIVISAVTLLAVPLLVLVIGAVVWNRRRVSFVPE
ncbi:MAG TPA: GldG family protein [Candidatus Dormibacteraeota bacterium]